MGSGEATLLIGPAELRNSQHNTHYEVGSGLGEVQARGLRGVGRCGHVSPLRPEAAVKGARACPLPTNYARPRRTHHGTPSPLRLTAPKPTVTGDINSCHHVRKSWGRE